MRLEHIPLIIGAIVALIGLGFIADASMAASAPPTAERRRRTRAEPSRAGEFVVGVGTLCMAAALFGRDTWRYGTVAVLAGSTLLLIGVILNRAFLKEALLFRGPARRAEEGSAEAGKHARFPQKPGRQSAGPKQDPIILGRKRDAADLPSGSPAPGTAAPAAAVPGPIAATPATPRPGAWTPPVGPATPPKVPASVRHPTPPLASPAYRPAEAVTPRGTPPLYARPSESVPPSAAPRAVDPPPPPPNAPPSGPKERRKSPRGKKK